MAQFSSTKDSCPIILLDCSGSTEHSIDVKKYFANIDNVLAYEINIAQRIMVGKNIKQVYVILWNYIGKVCSETPILVSDLTKIKMNSLGGTCLTKGLEVIPDKWINTSTNVNEKKEIYIFTDGEIEDDNIIISPLEKLINQGVRIQIITVEPNNINYVETKGDAGHKLFQAIKSNNLTKSVRRFSSYNEYHVLEPFISFDNPEEIDGFTSFQGEYFNIEEQEDELIDKVEDAVKSCETKDEIVKLAHDLSVTVYQMMKDKSIDEQNDINNKFADLFAESEIGSELFTQVNKMLMIEASNLLTGSGSSFHDFKDALILYET